MKSSRYGKINRSMNTTNHQVISGPPRLLQSIVAGFDSITNHITLLLFPIGLDLLIWFAPRVRIKALVDTLISATVSRSLQVTNDPETVELLNSAQELWTLITERFNLLIMLRTYPVGVPSLMSGVLPLEVPVGEVMFWEVSSFSGVIGIILVLTLIGVGLGTLYFSTVSQAAISNGIDWRTVLKQWPWLSGQVLLLAISWVVLLVGISIPASFAITFSAMVSAGLGQCVVFLFSVFLVWMLFPLLFTPHGIFVHHLSVWLSIKRSLHLTRMTLPMTSLFFLSIFLLSQALDMLWRAPAENSWLMLIGVAGHAFVTTGLLAASFIYYFEADQWLLNAQRQQSQEESPPEMLA